jgi:hypothetical protein
LIIKICGQPGRSGVRVGLRVLLREEEPRFNRMKTWKTSRDPDGCRAGRAGAGKIDDQVTSQVIDSIAGPGNDFLSTDERARRRACVGI